MRILLLVMELVVLVTASPLPEVESFECCKDGTIFTSEVDSNETFHDPNQNIATATTAAETTAEPSIYIPNAENTKAHINSEAKTVPGSDHKRPKRQTVEEAVEENLEDAKKIEKGETHDCFSTQNCTYIKHQRQ